MTNNQIINKIKSLYQTLKKNILSIYIKIGNSNLLPDYYQKCPEKYFEQALSYFNLDNYQILLFSDSITQAKKLLSNLNFEFKIADNFYTDKIDQFYMLMLSDIVIGSNSTIPLMSCYFNEIYQFKSESQYIFPQKWFGYKGPKLNINDYILNYKYFIIDYDNLEQYNTPKYDMVSPLHAKDKDRYKNFLKYNKKNLLEVNKIYYISYKKYDIEAEYISEDQYPFKKDDVIKYINNYIPNHRWGWYYQQLLKLYIFRIGLDFSDYILIFDSDLLILKPLLLFENDIPILFKRNTLSGKVHKPYLECQNILMKEFILNSNENDSGVCHFMLFKKNILEQLLNTIEDKHQKPAWQAILDSVIAFIDKNGYDDFSFNIFSEYELYYNYVKTLAKDKYKINTNLKFIDCPLKDINLINNNYDFIGDHHYQSRGLEDCRIDNLIEEELIHLKLF